MRRLTAAAGTAGLIVVGLGSSPALAEPGNQQIVPFTIHESQDFNVPGSPRFTSSDPLCPSGTFTDDFAHTAAWKGAASKLFLLQGTSVYTCDNGSGTILASKQVFVSFNDDGSLTATGPFKITGGTGAYAALSGSGRNTGSASAAGIAEATISGILVP